MAMKIAEAWIDIKGDMTHFIQDMGKSKRATSLFVGGTVGALKGITVGLAGITAAATAAAAAFTTLAIKTTRDAAKFSFSMAKVSTLITDSWQETTDVLSDSVRQLSTEIPKSAELLSEGLYSILSASVPVEKSMMALEIAGRAAVGGVTSVQSAAKLLTGTINGLGLSLNDFEKVSDLAFSAVAKGDLTFEELAGSIGRAIPATNKMNASVEELYGSMAFLTKNALSSDMAATAIGATYEFLSREAAKLKETIGVTVFGETGEYVGILEIIKQMRAQLAGLTEEAQTNILEEMGLDRQSGRAVITMIKNFEDFQSTMGDVANSAGESRAAFDKMKDELLNQWETLKNSLTNLSIVIGDSFTGIASDVIAAVKNIADNLSAAISGAGGLGKLWELHKDLVVATFKDIAVESIRVMGVMLKEMIKLVAAGARAIWQPMKTEARLYWTDFINWINFQMAKMTSNVADGTREGMERRHAEMQKAMNKWNNDTARIQQEGIDALNEIMGNLGDQLVESLSASGGAISTFTDKIRTELEDLRTEIGITIPGVGDAATGVEEIGEAAETTANQIEQFSVELAKFPEGLVATHEEVAAATTKIWREYFRQQRERYEGDVAAFKDFEKRRKATWDETVGVVKKALDTIFDAQDEALKKEKKLAKERLAIEQKKWNQLVNAVNEGLDEIRSAENAFREASPGLWRQMWDEVIAGGESFKSTMQNTLSDLLFTGFDPAQKPGWEEFWASVTEGFKRELADLTSALIVKGILALLGKVIGASGKIFTWLRNQMASNIDVTDDLKASVNALASAYRELTKEIRAYIIQLYLKAAAEELAEEDDVGGLKTISEGGLPPPPAALGGVFDKPTFALIGERGPEVVIPLHGGKVPVKILPSRERPLGGLLNKPASEIFSSGRATAPRRASASAMQVNSNTPGVSGGNTFIVNQHFTHANLNDITDEELQNFTDHRVVPSLASAAARGL